MMLLCLVFVYLLNIDVLSFPAASSAQMDSITSQYNRRTEKGYEFHFETKNGISRSEKGSTNDDGNLRVSGSYSFVTPEGRLIEVNYKADEHGYVPEKIIWGDSVSSRSFGPQGEQQFDVRIGTAAIASLTGGGMG